MPFSLGVSCVEELDSRSEEYDDEGGFTASVVLRCLWEDRFGLFEDLIGTPWPDMTKANCNRCVAKGDGPLPTVGGTMIYNHALVTASYSTKVVDFITESFEPTVEFQIQDHKLFNWGAANGDQLLEAEAPGRQIYGAVLNRTMYRLPFLPTLILTARGKCNEEEYTSGLLGLTFDPETLLFQPGASNRAIKSDGSDGWTLQTKFLQKPEGWNKFWRAKSQAYEAIFVKGGAEYKPYPPGDFSSILY